MWEDRSNWQGKQLAHRGDINVFLQQLCKKNALLSLRAWKLPQTNGVQGPEIQTTTLDKCVPFGKHFKTEVLEEVGTMGYHIVIIMEGLHPGGRTIVYLTKSVADAKLVTLDPGAGDGHTLFLLVFDTINKCTT